MRLFSNDEKRDKQVSLAYWRFRDSILEDHRHHYWEEFVLTKEYKDIIAKFNRPKYECFFIELQERINRVSIAYKQSPKVQLFIKHLFKTN